MTNNIEHDFRAAANRMAQAFIHLIEAVSEAEQRLRYSGDTFNKQGCWSSANACWAAADALPVALAPLLFPGADEVMTAPAPGTPSGQQNKAETVVTCGASCHHSTTPTPEGDLICAAKGLRRIVEEIDGAMTHGTWRDVDGLRLKDTPEWVAFYNALASLPASQAHGEEGKAAWRPIGGAPTLERVIVASWQPRHGNVAGYWWFHEDHTDEHGQPTDRPGALFFVRMADVLPPFPDGLKSEGLA